MSSCQQGKPVIKRTRDAENLLTPKKRRAQSSDSIDLTLDSPRFSGSSGLKLTNTPDQLANQRGQEPVWYRRQHAPLRTEQQSRAEPSTSPDVIVVDEQSPVFSPRNRVEAARSHRPHKRERDSNNRESLPLPSDRGVDSDVDAALARSLQAEEDRKLAAAEAALAARMDELEAAEALAEATEPSPTIGAGLRSLEWPFGRRRQPRQRHSTTVSAAGIGGDSSVRWRRRCWGESMADLFSSGFNTGHPRFIRGPPSNLFAFQQAIQGARCTSLPPQLLFSDRDFNDQDYEMLLRLDESVERKGAPQHVIDSLSTVRVGHGSLAGSQLHHDDCAICLEACKAGDVLRKLPCGHYYHKVCIDKWLKSKATCPVCLQLIH